MSSDNTTHISKVDASNLNHKAIPHAHLCLASTEFLWCTSCDSSMQVILKNAESAISLICVHMP